jgi:4-amino-4-deoxy-L-arabinose transferase-like glycosyltransferase
MRPDIVLFLLMFSAAIVLVPARGRPRFRTVAVLLASAAVVIAPWTIRNWTCFHKFCLVSANGGFNFYMGNHPGTGNEVDLAVIAPLDERLHGELARADEIERERIFYREGLRWIRENPRDAGAAMLARLGMHWGFRPSNVKDMGLVPGVKASRDWVYFFHFWSYALSYLVVLVLAVPGIWRARRRWGELAPLGIVILYSTAVAVLFVVQTKMRLMKVEPFLLVFAAAFVVDRLSRGRAGAGLAGPSASASR